MMSFNESINTLVNSYGLKILNDKFKTLSYLLDCVGSNHYEKKLVECFMCVHYQENLVFLFKKKGILRTRKYLQNKYPSYKNNYTKIRNLIYNIDRKLKQKDVLSFVEVNTQNLS